MCKVVEFTKSFPTTIFGEKL